ncbi:MAG TPA: hypothetical protein VKN64_04725 [Halanaerobiales bacterium]|nr:hypothetical protein [Halanaerobiales bacterium]
MKKKILIKIIITFFIITAGVFIFYNWTGKTIKKEKNLGWNNSSHLNSWIEEVRGEEAKEKLNSLPEELFTEKYEDEEFNFSFKYPKDFNIGKFKNGEDSKIILVQYPKKKIGVQIIITPLDEKTELTKELINERVPSYTVENPQPVEIDGKKRGLVFKSKNDNFGESREIWFIFRDILYQISSYQSLDPFIKTFFETFQF